MNESATINFHDHESEQDATIIVRSDGNNVWLCISMESNGDIELAMDKHVAQRVLEAIKAAM